MFELFCEYLSVLCICLYVIIMSHTRFRENLQSIVARISTSLLPEASATSEVELTATRFEPTTTYFLNERSII